MLMRKTAFSIKLVRKCSLLSVLVVFVEWLVGPGSRNVARSLKNTAF